MISFKIDGEIKSFSDKDTGLGCHFLLQGIFLTQGITPRSPALQADS